jgi:hypothetical protein
VLLRLDEDAICSISDCFTDEFDCNVDENAVWDNVIDEYLNNYFNTSDRHIAEIIRTALEAAGKYGSDHIDVVRDNETDKIAVMYHSDNNSFCYNSETSFLNIPLKEISLDDLEAELDKINVGHCW